MKKYLSRLAYIAVILFVAVEGFHPVYATGITADVGMTPPTDRWIFRSQLRYAERDNEHSMMEHSMGMYMVPVVLGYGLRPGMTIIGKQPIMHRTMTMMGMSSDQTGLGDLAIITKYRLFRLNHPEYIIAVAPTLGVKLPTGDDEFSSDTWDLLMGVYMSGRKGRLGADLNLEYKLNGVEDRQGDRPGDEFTTTAAVAYQLSLDKEATMSLWPVLEVTYNKVNPNRENGQEQSDSGEELILLSPGMKLAFQSLMFELLIQFPVHEDQTGHQMTRKIGGLVGLRYMF